MAAHALEAHGYLVSSDPALLDLDVIHGYLRRAYWSEGIPRQIVERAIAHSVCVGAYRDGAQVGFARAITDHATFAYVADVFVLEEHQGRGVGTLIMRCLTTHPDLQGFRRWLLLTRDAHALYRKFGFDAHPDPNRVMIKQVADIYNRRR